MSLFAELGIIIAIATGMAVMMRILRQPLIIGHILSGLIVGPFVLGIVESSEVLALMSEFGVAILLFTVGLHLSPSIIHQFGRISLITGIGQVVITSIAGLALCLYLGYNGVESFYIGVALAFSSTIIIMKLIADKGEIDVLYARIAVGFLLVQDIIAVLLLLGIPLFSASTSFFDIARFFLAGGILIGFIYFTSRFFLPRVSRFIEEDREFLFLFAIMWGIGVAAVFKQFGFSLESGALIAGVSLATLSSRQEMSARLAPLRDFFIVIFFIFLGAQLQLGNIYELIPTAIILSLLVLIGNPLILMGIMGYLGYRKRTSLATGMTVAQISEFSLIMVALGVALGHVPQSVLSLVTLVGLITIFGSTYLVLYTDQIYKVLAPYLGIFERSDARETRIKKHKPEIVLFGCNRIGYTFLESLTKMQKEFLVVDYNPATVHALESSGIPVVFGDASDIAFLEDIDFSDSELVISTIPDTETNALVNAAVQKESDDAVVIVVAHRATDALSHYDQGIDYVIVPHLLGGRHAAELVLKLRGAKHRYGKVRREHIDDLNLRIAIGHEEGHHTPSS
jgi:Kef-type K+ transport system membrane component KefB